MAALVAFFVGVYPFILLAAANDWARGVQIGFGVAGFMALFGVKLAVVLLNRHWRDHGDSGRAVGAASARDRRT